MANSEEKVSQFIQAISRYAEEQSHSIREEVARFKQEHLAQAEQQVLTEAAALMEQERVAIHNEMSHELAQRDNAARRQLLERRAAIMQAVFDQAREKLIAFTDTDAYTAVLRDSLLQLQAVLPADGAVYQIRRADEGHLSALSDLLPAGSRIELTDEIVLGGIRGENRAAGILADDTLDARLCAQTEWFESHSGLTVEV